MFTKLVCGIGKIKNCLKFIVSALSELALEDKNVVTTTHKGSLKLKTRWGSHVRELPPSTPHPFPKVYT
jgi:hypothetical protein